MMAEFEKILNCPFCKSEWSHHGEINVFQRDEDNINTIVTNITPTFGTIVATIKDCKENPSSRRHGISVAIKCESCLKPYMLLIYQHKGQTFVECKVSDWLLKKEDFRQQLVKKYGSSKDSI